MAKKETTTKKATKKVSSRKATTKNTEVVEEASIMEAPIEDINLENVETEQVLKDDVLFQEQVLKHVASEILAEKNNSIEEFLDIPQKEMINKAKEKIENIKKINNQKVNDRIDNLFGYLWNGQEMDY